MTISAESWMKYINALSKVNEAATNELSKFINAGFSYSNPEDMRRLIGYAYGISTKYGEAAAELACQMYDAVGLASGMLLEPAVPAEVATYGEVAKTIYGTAKTSQNTDELLGAMVRLVKRAGQDTTIKNAIRDGAEFAWIPNGDTCAFCITLASRGWQQASPKALKSGHAEHIHANCDCTYGVRFNGRPSYKNYNPDEYLEQYEAAEGKNSKDKINSLRRIRYQENKDRINAQKRAAYAEKHSLLKLEATSPFKNPGTPLTIDSFLQSKHIVDGAKYNSYLETHKYPPSTLIISDREIQELVDKYHGTGIIRLDKNGNVIPQEMIVDNDKVIGYAINNNNGKKVETTGFKIHYSEKGTHVVPMYQNQKDYWKERRKNNGHDWLFRQKG